MFKLLRKPLIGLRYQSTEIPKHLQPPPKSIKRVTNPPQSPNHNIKPPANLLHAKFKEEKDLRKARNKLAKASMRDIFAIFSPSGSIDEDEDLDLSNFNTKPIYENPILYNDLPFHKQQFIIDEINEKFKKKWVNIDKDMKRFNCWLCYGSHGPREGFPNLYDYYSTETDTTPHTESQLVKITSDGSLDALIKKSSSNPISEPVTKTSPSKTPSNKPSDRAPIDLPFKVPSILQTINATPETIIKELPTMDPRSFGAKRIEQYKKDSQMNPINKIILMLLVFLTIVEFKVDRKVNLTGNVPEYVWDIKEREMQEIERVKESEAARLNEELAAKQKKEQEGQIVNIGRKWYWLWLK